ncbi:LOW QUALITY PROTEIN: transcriptional repressor NF-X1-like [Saccostrea cucullata]|uniref:LOW QUALITY PROTEIN: transcriptional repressor NF-X1-like n=1 Tax=Saccostrea cuccullata TaxID=36930 RepID=UPI002ED62887
MASYYSNPSDYGQSYGEFDPQSIPYPHPVNFPPPPVHNPAMFPPPPGQFFVPNLNNFQTQYYGDQGIQRQMSQSDNNPQGLGQMSGNNNAYHNNQMKQDRRNQNPNSARGYRPQSARGQGHRGGHNQGYRGNPSQGYREGQTSGYEWENGQGYERGQGYRRGQRHEKLQGHRLERGQRSEKYGSVKERDQPLKQNKEESGKVKDNADKENEKQSENEKLYQEKSSKDQNLEEEKADVKEKKIKSYKSDQDFFEKNFAAFSSKEADNPKSSIKNERKRQQGNKGAERPKSAQERSEKSQNQYRDYRHSPRENKPNSDYRGNKYDSRDDNRENKQSQKKRENRQEQRNSPRDYPSQYDSNKRHDRYDDDKYRADYPSQYDSNKRHDRYDNDKYRASAKDILIRKIENSASERKTANKISNKSDSLISRRDAEAKFRDIEEDRSRKDSESVSEYSDHDSGKWTSQDNLSVNEKERKNTSSYNNYRATGNQGQQPYYKGQKKPRVFRTSSGKVDESQRALLIEQLTMGTYECMVCCETIRGQNAVWSCNGCYHIFHLRCIKTWARSPTARVEGSDNGWRCPACQTTTEKFPNQYRCFCGKVRDPEWNRMETPHSCGEVCRKIRSINCKHNCNILCHPGPCPPCNAVVPRHCLCGKTSQSTKCSSVEVFRCSSVCDKQLNCGKHFCKAVCHDGQCEPCQEVIKQECYGSHETREITCGSSESFTDSFCCGKTCSKKLNCGNHECKEVCHEGPCQSCLLLPEVIKTCPCGARDLKDLGSTPRQSCLDPIPTCGNKCGKPLKCGPSKKPHICERKCHEGPCGPCDLTTEMTCRCTKFKKEFPCTEVMKLPDRVFLCERKCNKLRSCQRHKCGQHCCVSEDHPCSLICGKKLPCGLHKCEELCHRGKCPPCLMASFDELTCRCGAEIMYPPIPCGTKPPECKQICSRVHSCDHEIHHRCHSDENCPPCTFLTEKWCMGKHELRKNIACHRDNISCGLPCNKVLPCQQHKCTKVCHSGPCQTEGEKCKQPCQIKRENCDHPCANPCHYGNPCPANPCKAKVKIKCSCGNREATVSCQSLDSPEFKSMQTLATPLGSGQSVDISHLTSQKKARKQKVLECDADCALIERNRRLALALEIKNPDLQAKLGSPSYSEFLRDFTKKNLHIVSSVEKSFNDLVQNAKKAKQAYRSHSFPSMNRDQRRLIHELAECYGCETQSYDYEPNKNVVATAYKDKCWLPTVTLTAYVQREMHPKAPTPIPHRHNETEIRESALAAKQSFEVLKDKPIETVQRSNNSKDKASGSKVIDYFDFSTQ